MEMTFVQVRDVHRQVAKAEVQTSRFACCRALIIPEVQ